MAEGQRALEGRVGLVTGIANDQSIAYGCARAMRSLGADLAVTYLNDKAKKHVEPLARDLEAAEILQLDVTEPGRTEAVFEAIDKRWGKLDFVLHSMAFAPREDLHGRVVDSSREGFLQAMDISCHSFLRMSKYAEPLMKEGGTLITMSYLGSVRVVDNYNLMGPVKAALEACVRYMAVELGAQGIRVHAVSPGPLKTRAASGISNFDRLLDRAASQSPLHALATIDDVGFTTAFLCTDYARMMTGSVIYVDGGYNIVA
ncbi:MAG: enoyl-[acyl-carrier-protein] reductase FabI [Geminicoccaceae bacterium]|nr:MAG: enoyl-[acyl-carrier-protein] reductase FabI [Geminicoccaceae bacterium]